MRFSIRDLVVLIGVLALLLAILVPALIRNRDGVRATVCRSHLKFIGLGLHNYHLAFRQLPSAMSGTQANGHRLSGLVAIVPFLEHQELWEQIANPLNIEGVAYPAMGVVPWDTTYPPWQQQCEVFRCPCDATKQTLFGITNYTFCIGDSAVNIHTNKPMSQTRGAFAPRQVTRFKDIIDGMSHTIAVAEIATKQGNRVRGQFAVNSPPTVLITPSECLSTSDSQYPSYYAPSVKLSDLGRGANWADGAAGYSLVQTILPPNKSSCAVGGPTAVDGIYSASSRHPEGCHVLMADASVVFITNQIDTGDLSAVPPASIHDTSNAPILSPYGVWGALGTRAGEEGDVGFDYP